MIFKCIFRLLLTGFVEEWFRLSIASPRSHKTLMLYCNWATRELETSVQYNEGATVISVALLESIPRGQQRSNQMVSYTDTQYVTSTTACYKQTWRLSTSGNCTKFLFIQGARTNTLNTISTAHHQNNTPVTVTRNSRSTHGPYSKPFEAEVCLNNI
jgi:hypothetical protein